MWEEYANAGKYRCLKRLRALRLVFICFLPVPSIGNSKIERNDCPKELTSFVIRKGEKKNGYKIRDRRYSECDD